MHAGKRFFITGIPTSGKSYLAKKIAAKTGGVAVLLDDFRESLANDAAYKKWTNFYIDLDEKAYLTSTSSDEQWKNLVAQSEGLWPAFLDEIEKFRSDPRTVVFECVNLLPHLVAQLGFPGVVLIGSDFDSVLERNMAEPRWGNTRELQKLEAHTFFFVERPRYIAEAKKFDLPVFEKADDAFETALSLLGY